MAPQPSSKAEPSLSGSHSLTGWAHRLHRPLQLGLSVGHPRGGTGSIGPFVRLRDGRAGFLSSGIVLAPGRASRSDMIHQPGPLHQPVLTGQSRAATLEDFTVLVPGAGMTMHYGSAALLEGIEFAGNVMPEACEDRGLRIGTVIGQALLERQDEVAFVGAGSGWSAGRVEAISVSGIRIPWKDSFVTLQDGIVIEGVGDSAFSRPGDGGALVYRRHDGAAIGMVLASTRAAEGDGQKRHLSYLMPLAPILAAIGATLLT